MRKMGGLKTYMPITYWTFVVGAAAIAGVPGLAGFFSKDEILFLTYYNGNTWLWVIGALTGMLTATYMFRLIFMTFHGEPRFAAPETHGDASHHRGGEVEAAAAHGGTDHSGHGHGHHGEPHESPWPMALPLVVLAIGSVLAGYIGVPHALGGHNEIEGFLHPSFAPFEAHGPAVAGDTHGESAAGQAASAAGHEADEAGKTRIELTLMGVSTVLAFAGIGLAAFFFLRKPEAADNAARTFAPVHRTLLNKYYVDEIYDAAFVTPLKRGSEGVLWKGVDVGLIDGAVNGVGHLVRSSAGALRRLQTGSVRMSAASLFVGVLLVLGYYLAR